MQLTELPIPGRLRLDHSQRGGRDLKRYVAELVDGVLRVMVAREPAGRQGRMVWHISITVAAGGDIGASPTRRPTALEIDYCRQLLPGVELIVGREGSPLAAHLWERE